MRRWSNPDDYCPICGKRLPKVKADTNWRDAIHECPSRTLMGIDSADARASNDELDDWTADPARRCYAERVAEGFRLLAEVEDGPMERGSRSLR